MRRPSPPDSAERPRPDPGAQPGALEATSQPGLSRRFLELRDGRYLLAYERTKKPVDA